MPYQSSTYSEKKLTLSGKYSRSGASCRYRPYQPLNYEVYAIEQVKGFDTNNLQTVVFSPMYKAPDIGLFPEAQTQHAYFSARRADRVPSETQLKMVFALPI